MHGRGRYEWVDGIVFEGHFRDNVAEGHGTYSWPDGARYEGQIRRGLRHGRGVMRFADAPTWYDGEWRDGMRHGRGVLAFDADASCRYDGEWARDKKHGRGTFVYASGNRYDGEWANDRKHGLGHVLARPRRGVRRRVARRPPARPRHAPMGPPRRGRGRRMVHHPKRVRGRLRRGTQERPRRLLLRHRRDVRRPIENDEKHGVGSYTFEDGSVFRGGFERPRGDLAERPAVRAHGVPPPGPGGLTSGGAPDRRESVAAKIDHLALRYASEPRAPPLAAVRAATKTNDMPANPEKAVP